MNATITTAPWLGKSKDYGYETFPETTLNEKQIRALFMTSEGSRRVLTLCFTTRPAILKLTDEITEIHVQFGRSSVQSAHLIFWYDQSGNTLAVVEEKYEGPQGVHKPGDKFRKWAVAYLRHPGMSPFEKAEEVEYEYLYGIGRDGALGNVREYVRTTWIDNNDDNKEQH